MSATFMATRDQEVAAELLRRCGLDTEAVHAIDAQQDPFAAWSIAIDGAQGIGDTAKSV